MNKESKNALKIQEEQQQDEISDVDESQNSQSNHESISQSEQNIIEQQDESNKDQNVNNEIKKILKQAQSKTKKLKKMGVVYLSRIPPFMNPSSLRKLVEQKFDGVERIYMEQERDHERKNRVKSGGNRKQKYTEGWIEFKDKKVAKKCAELLNNTQIGGKKRNNLFYDDIWNIKYLKHFKWSHLTEKLAYDQKVRELRLKAETNEAKRQYSFYQEKRALSQKLNKIEESKQKSIDNIDQQIKSISQNKVDVNISQQISQIEQKKQKNIEKMFKYQQKKNKRTFKQREPILTDHIQKRQKTE